MVVVVLSKFWLLYKCFHFLSFYLVYSFPFHEFHLANGVFIIKCFDFACLDCVLL